MVGSESRYRAFLDALDKDHLRRALSTIEAQDARSLTVGGRSYVNLASNDYLALRFQAALIERAREWAAIYGVGSGASRLVTGDLDLFERIEAKVAQLKGKPAALIMASGFQANAAVLQALFDRTVLGAEPLIVDDAHATGILGAGGSGLSGGADIVVGTFSKALGSFGAYVASSSTMRDYLVNRCSGFIYSTALPPPVLGAIDAALDLVPGLDEARTHVASIAARFRARARERGYDTGASSSQIVPLIAGTAEASLSLSKSLREAGFWATPIRPPTVPQGTARVRLAFTAAHTDADIDRLLEALGQAAAPETAKAASR